MGSVHVPRMDGRRGQVLNCAHHREVLPPTLAFSRLQRNAKVLEREASLGNPRIAPHCSLVKSQAVWCPVFLEHRPGGGTTVPALYLVTFLVCAYQSPAAIDRDLAKQVEDLERQRSEVTPKPSPAEENNRRIVCDGLKNIGDEGKALLRDMCLNGPIYRSTYWSRQISGIDHRQLDYLLKRCTSAKLVKQEADPNGRSGSSYSIPDPLRTILADMLAEPRDAR